MSTTYPIRILSQLSPVLQGFRKARGLTQAELAARLGVSQQSYARLEANPGRASMTRVLAALQALEVDLALTPRGQIDAGTAAKVSKAPKANAPKTPPAAKTARPARSRKPRTAPGEDW